MRLSGRNVLVTGSSQGIGQEIAYRFAQEGADVVINYRGKPDAANQTVAKIRDLGRKSLAIAADLTSISRNCLFRTLRLYCASKGGLKMMMRNLAIELGPYGITVNNIAPGAIETPINTQLLNDQEKLKALLANIPLGRLGQVGDVAGVAAFLTSEDAGYITGATIVVDGGLTWNYSEE
jgi:glucose 1-dehydrogenase